MTLIPATFTYIALPTNLPQVETPLLNEETRKYPIVLQIVLTLVFCIALFQILVYLGMLFIQFYGHVKERNTRYFRMSVWIVFPLTLLVLSRAVLVSWSLTVLPKIWVSTLFYELSTFWSLWILVGWTVASKWLSFYYSFFQPGLAKQQIKQYEDHFNEYLDIFIVIPVSHESSTHLMWTLESIVESDYPKSKLHIVMAMDEDSDGLEYILLLKQFNILSRIQKDKYAETHYKGVKLYICKWYASGKRSSQKFAIEVIRRKYRQDTSIKYDPLLLLLDSDAMLETFSLHNAVCHFSQDPKLVALSGETVFSDIRGMYSLFDAMDSWSMRLFTRPVQQHLFTCRNLPGKILFIKFLAFRDIELRYFADSESKLWSSKFHRLNFGDHLYLQSLIQEHYGPMRLGYDVHVTASTWSMQSFASYCYQKRRHFLGFISNAFANGASQCMLSRSWLLYTSYCVDLILQQCWVPVILLLISSGFSGLFSVTPFLVLCFAWLVQWVLFSLAVRKWTAISLYPIYMLLIRPFLEFVSLCLSVWTWNDMSWGLCRGVQEKVVVPTTRPEFPFKKGSFQEEPAICDDELIHEAIPKQPLDSNFLSEWPSNFENSLFSVPKKNPKRPSHPSESLENSSCMELSILEKPTTLASRSHALRDLTRMDPQPFFEE